MSVRLATDTPEEATRLLALLALGLCEALSAGAISIEDAQARLFNPYTQRELDARPLDPALTEIIALGSELEDVASLLPERLPAALADLRRRALAVLRAQAPALDAPLKWLEPL